MYVQLLVFNITRRFSNSPYNMNTINYRGTSGVISTFFLRGRKGPKNNMYIKSIIYILKKCRLLYDKISNT